VTSLDRRSFLRRGAQLTGAAVLAGGAISALDACGSSASSGTAATGGASSAKAASLGSVTFQLSWLENVQFAGSYIAEDRGYYTAAGLSGVTLLTGGPTTASEPIVTSGKALAGSDSPDRAAAAINQGAPLKIIAATYQKSPYAMLSMAKSPINSPSDMIGKKIGIPAGDSAIWAGFLKANNIDPSSIPTIPVQSDPSPLSSGEVDGWLAFATSEPITLETRGYKVHTFLLADYNYAMFADTYIATENALQNQRDELKAFMTGEVRGWQDQLKDPSLGVDLAMTKYGANLGLNRQQQMLEATAQNQLLTSSYTSAHGLLSLSPQVMTATVATLKHSGIDTTVDALFDASLMTEVFGGKTSL
jgi:ABC-type nitrate/sulfonate/bicarbonate transport system substrate-binding protein